MKITCLLFIILCGTFSCDHVANQEDKGINQVVLSTKSEIQHKYHATGTGVGLSALNGIKSMTLYFEIKGNIGLNKARDIVVDSANIFLNNINTNVLLRPFLAEYPFPNSRLHLTFWFTDGSYDQDYTPGILKAVSLSQGRIEYLTVGRKGKFKMGDKDVVMHQESFEDARRIVESEKNI